MALITPMYFNCVVAIGKENGNGVKSWIGTGFLFGYRIKNVTYTSEDSYTIFLVSNKHVLRNQDYVLLRFNPQGNLPAQDYRLDLKKGDQNLCKFHPSNNVDVAVVGIPQVYFDNLIKNKVNPSFFAYPKNCYSVSDMKNIEVTEGDSVFALGFPMGNVGNTRQYVILRGGVISRIHDLLDGFSSDYIIDAPVFPGNSGGPVIIKPEFTHITGTQSQTQSRLVGLVKSYISYNDVAISPQTGRPRVVFEENTGLTNVEPVDYIIETILQ